MDKSTKISSTDLGMVCSGDVAGYFQCRSVLLIWIVVWQGPTVLAAAAGGGCLDFLFSFSLSLEDGSI